MCIANAVKGIVSMASVPDQSTAKRPRHVVRRLTTTINIIYNKQLSYRDFNYILHF